MIERRFRSVVNGIVAISLLSINMRPGVVVEHDKQDGF